jgi:hypothetical protein
MGGTMMVAVIFGGVLLIGKCQPHLPRSSARQIDVRRSIKLRQLAKTLCFLALAGCASGGDLFHQNEPIKAAPPTVGAVPQAVPNRSKLSPAAGAAAPPEANGTPGELMDCVTQSCRINCSPKVAVRFRPKWCANFKEPTE